MNDKTTTSRAPRRALQTLIPAMLALAGCVAADGAVDLAPESLEASEHTLAQIDAMLEVDPNDPAALEMLEALGPRLDELNHLVAEVELSPDHSVRFFEAEPGVIGVSERMLEGDTPVLDEEAMGSMSMVEVYERLASLPAPRALLDAQTRVDAATSQAIEVLEESDFVNGDSELAANEEFGMASAALTGAQYQYFRDNLCFTYGYSRGCYTNSAGGRWAQNEAKTSFFTVAPYDGHVSVRFFYEGSQRFIEPVYQGEVRSYWWHSGTYRKGGGNFNPRDYLTRTHRWEIIHASGDHLHWTYAFRKNCDYRACDAFPR